MPKKSCEMAAKKAVPRFHPRASGMKPATVSHGGAGRATERSGLLEAGPSGTSDTTSASCSDFTVNELLELGGGFGRYQRLLMATLCFWYALGSTTTLLPIFLLPELQESWSLEPVHFALIESGFFAGNMIGLLVGGGVSDVYGRRYAFRLGFGMVLAASALTFLAAHVPLLVVARLLTGFGYGFAQSCFVLLLEFCCTASQRTSADVVINVGGWAAGMLWLTGVAYALQWLSWRALIVALLPAAFVGFALTQLLESPRYHVARGNSAKALEGLREVAAFNGRPLPPSARLQLPSACTSTGGVLSAAMQLLHPSLRRRTVLLTASWVGSTCSYYGVTLWQLDFGGGLYLQNALGAALEIPAFVLMKVLADRCGRRVCWSVFLVAITTSLMLLSTLPGESLEGVLGTCLALVARMSASGASTIAWLATSEQYPTSCRNVGVGYGASCGRFGSILAPIVVNLLPQPGVWLGFICALSTACVLLLSESRGVAPPETIGTAASDRSRREDEGEAAAAPPRPDAPLQKPSDV